MTSLSIRDGFAVCTLILFTVYAKQLMPYLTISRGRSVLYDNSSLHCRSFNISFKYVAYNIVFHEEVELGTWKQRSVVLKDGMSCLGQMHEYGYRYYGWCPGQIDPYSYNRSYFMTVDKLRTEELPRRWMCCFNDCQFLKSNTVTFTPFDMILMLPASRPSLKLGTELTLTCVMQPGNNLSGVVSFLRENTTHDRELFGSLKQKGDYCSVQFQLDKLHVPVCWEGSDEPLDYPFSDKRSYQLVLKSLEHRDFGSWRCKHDAFNITSAVVYVKGVSGARCLSCSRLDEKCVFPYQLPFLIDTNVCENVRSDGKTELDLCKRYPDGYQLQCELNNLSEITCKLPCISYKQDETGRRTRNGCASVAPFCLETFVTTIFVILLFGSTCI